MSDNTIKFSHSNPLIGLNTDKNIKLYDVHVHYHSSWYSNEFLEACKKFNITKIMCITSPKIKKKIEKKGSIDNITFCYFLGQFNFMRFKSQRLINQVNQAKKNGFSAFKIFFGPRLWQFTLRRNYYKINDPKLTDFYSKLDEEGLPVLIHVADPDIWYTKRYKNVKKYGTKEDRINDFIDLLERFPNIPWISAHLGSIPEDLPTLGTMLDKFRNLHVDTGSTKWMIRELGRKINQTKDWFSKYQDRILWGSDISNMSDLGMLLSRKTREFYWYSRFWSHRLFWETDEIAELAFKDNYNPHKTIIDGLGLSHDILSKIYFENANNLLNKND